jgi:hypothetical protein
MLDGKDVTNESAMQRCASGIGRSGLTEGECHESVATIHKINGEGTAILWIEHVLHVLDSAVERLMVPEFEQTTDDQHLKRGDVRARGSRLEIEA